MIVVFFPLEVTNREKTKTKILYFISPRDRHLAMQKLYDFGYSLQALKVVELMPFRDDGSAAVEEVNKFFDSVED